MPGLSGKPWKGGSTMGLAQWVLAGVSPCVRQSSSTVWSNVPDMHVALYSAMVRLVCSTGRPSLRANASMLSACVPGNTGGMKRPIDLRSMMDQAIWPGCWATSRPHMAYRLGQKSSPSS
ncbi:Uncharacterised protein [Bordetella pertussis]|nr:Uncharacterised protein [Bordetella pertussis]CFU37138.1 Uncharacterised protein [Bordetella pertussis]CFV95440.1 Uncharacterised protein [Bordetella pertussis]CPK41335.1 Uncharacterised protein [Bordetella pertussis]CPO28139.1 Uncharacterised protein [Bordetella pertussis]